MPVLALVTIPALPSVLEVIANARPSFARRNLALGLGHTVRVALSGVTTVGPAFATAFPSWLSLALAFALAFARVLLLVHGLQPRSHSLHLHPHRRHILIQVPLVIELRYPLRPMYLGLEPLHHRVHRLYNHLIGNHPRVLHFCHRVLPFIEHLYHILMLHHHGHFIYHPVNL